MKLAVNLPAQGAVALAEAAEELGFDLALAPEGYRSDAPSVLGAVAARTRRIALGSAVMQIPARPPATAALTAATLDMLSEGRFRLGLGVSNPDVSEGWYGVPFARPLARTREYVEIVRTVLRGGPVTYRGNHFVLPGTDRAAAPPHLFTEGYRTDLPIYLAAVGPAALRLTGEIADGWLGVFTSPEMVREAVGRIAGSRAACGLSMENFDVLPSLPTAVADDLEQAADQLRHQYCYLLGIGDPETNFYCSLARRLGFGPAIERVIRCLGDGDRRAAEAHVPLDLIDRTALIGPTERIAARMREYAAAGVTTLGIMVSAASTTSEGRLDILEACAKAVRSW